MVNKSFVTFALVLCSSVAMAQSKIRPPDLLGDDAAPQVQQPAATEDMIETDKEPVPIIRKEKVTADSVTNPTGRYIEHPNAQKGLIKIDKDKVYYYKVKESDQSKAGNFKIGTYDPGNLAGSSGTSYDEIYDESNSPMIQYEQEWQIWKQFGRFGITAGGGFFMASGNGQFKAGTNNGQRPREKFTFIVFPVNAGVIYRAQFYDKQPLVPYGGAGIGGMLFAERRDDDNNPALGARFGASPVAHAYAGGALQLGRGARSFLDLDREYGINKIWLTLEYRRYIFVAGDFDFSGDNINGGLTAEF